MVTFCLRLGYDLVTQKSIWLRFGYEIDVFGYDLVTGRPVPGTIWLRAIWLRFGYAMAEKCGGYYKNAFSTIFWLRAPRAGATKLFGYVL